MCFPTNVQYLHTLFKFLAYYFDFKIICLKSVSSTYPTFFNDNVLFFIYFTFSNEKSCDVKKKHYENNTSYDKYKNQINFFSMQLVFRS